MHSRATRPRLEIAKSSTWTSINASGQIPRFKQDKSPPPSPFNTNIAKLRFLKKSVQRQTDANNISNAYIIFFPFLTHFTWSYHM